MAILGSINPIMQKDFDTACAELDVNCVHGENILDLIEQGVDAIVNASNRWDVMGSSPAIHEAAAQGIIAGINAAQYVKQEEPLTLERSDAYAGVLIDDLVSVSVDE